MADERWLLKLIVTVCLGATSSSFDEHYQERDEIIRHVILEPAHVINRRSIDQPLRISLDFLDLSSLEDQATVKTVVEKARDYFSKTLKVRKTVSKILLQRRCSNYHYFLKNDSGLNSGRVRFCLDSCSSSKKLCGPVDIPEHDLDSCRTCNEAGKDCKSDSSAGVGHSDTDFVLYVMADGGDCTENKTIAYGAACQQDNSLDRPVAGYINICPKKVTEMELKTSYEEVLATIKHEIFHALGFSPSLYAFFRDRNGSPFTPRGENGLPRHFFDGRYQWSEETVKEVIRDDWLTSTGTVPHKVYVMVTPKVREETRQHFNCLTLEGAELENQGGKGTFLAHWEKRLFENEGMTGVFTQNPVFSRLTLALMEDTGWYEVDYSMAEPLRWGKNMGCLFATNSCKAWMNMQEKGGNAIEPFCDVLEQSLDGIKTGCSVDRTSVAKCNLMKYDMLLPEEYQYFNSIPDVVHSEGAYGGAVDLADFCPYFQAFTWIQKGKELRTSSCISPKNNPNNTKNSALELYGGQSRCFEQEKNWFKRDCKVRWTATNWGSGCYEYLCEKGGVKIKILEYEFRCFYKGQRIEITVEHQDWEYNGVLVCPSCEEVCFNSGIRCPAEINPAPANSQPVPPTYRVCSQGLPYYSTCDRYKLLLLCVCIVSLIGFPL